MNRMDSGEKRGEEEEVGGQREESVNGQTIRDSHKDTTNNWDAKSGSTSQSGARTRILTSKDTTSNWDAKSGSTSQSGARTRKLTEKGHKYMLEIKSKTLKSLFDKLRKRFVHMEQLVAEVCDFSMLKSEHTHWLSLYEEYLDTYHILLTSVPEVENLFEDKTNLLLMYKRTIDGWFINGSKSGKSSISPHDSVSQVSRRKSLPLSLSRGSSVSSAKIRGEQNRAEISAKLSALESKRNIELAKLNIKLEEEELELKTKMNIENAKAEILVQYEQSASGYKRKSLSNVNHKQTHVKQTNLQSNCSSDVKPLRPKTPSFTPASYCHRECKGYDYCLLVESNDDNEYFKPQVGETNHFVSDSVAKNQVIVDVVKQLRKPIPDIKGFGGDPLDYKKFMRQFKTKISLNSNDCDECLSYLEQFTYGEARKIVDGFAYLDASVGYPAALRELHERYGDEEVLANAFVKRALDWPLIKSENPKTLDEFAIFLSECNNAIQSIEAVKVLQYPDNMKRLVSKLPFYFHDKWRTIVQQIKQRSGTVMFSHLADFVKKEAKKACDPTYGREALRIDSKPFSGKGQPSKQNHFIRSPAKGSYATNVYSASADEQTDKCKDMTSNQYNAKAYCINCEDSSHPTDHCNILSKLSYAERIEFVKSKGLCYGCLKSGHRNKDCKARCICSICKYRHPTVLHNEKFTKRRETDQSRDSHDNANKQYPNKVNAAVTSTTDSASGCTGAGEEGDCTMAVIPVTVKLKNGLQVVTTYAFLDPGSNVSFCTEELLRKLGGNGQCKRITLDTMGIPHTMDTIAINGLQVGDLESKNMINLPVVYTKTKMPIAKEHIPTSNDIADWPHLNDVTLPYIDCRIGLLIGNNVPDAYTPIQVRTGPRGSPHASQTLLGWIVWNLVRGIKTPNTKPIYPSVNQIEVMAIHDQEQLQQIDTLMRHSINLEFPERQVDDKKELSQEDKRFLKHVESVIYHEEEHYYINLPFRKKDVYLPNNKPQALQRLESLKRKMIKNEDFCQDYKTFVAQLIEKGYAEKVKDNQQGRVGCTWYIPHYGVYHPRKPGKLRVVFDCSATYLGVSLNGVLLPGPDLTNNLLGVLLRFRRQPVAIMGDIEAMFYQVRVPEEDRDFLRFFWWPDGNIDSNPEVYRMRVHLFGAVSSPGCSSYALRQTAADNLTHYDVIISEGVRSNFYVDDYLASAATADDAVALIKDTTSMCGKGGFRLTKWTSNSHRVLESVKAEDQSNEVKILNLKQDILPSERALGVYWIAESDHLGFQVSEKVVPCTRRGILSLSSSVYDPLGITAPFVLVAKCILQELCRQGVSWDDEIPDAIKKKWIAWTKDLKLLEDLHIPRCYKPIDFKKVVSCELHNFSDASTIGYGMVTYLRFIDEEGRIHCSFVFGKARVAQLKKVTIPRMELTAATAAVRLNAMLQKELDITVDKSYFWTDSAAVLRYIANSSSRFHTFVANRIEVIREATNIGQWRFVGTGSNPADCASRGTSMTTLLQKRDWFNGPDFLRKPSTEWPETCEMYSASMDEDPEVKHTTCATLVKDFNITDRMISHYSEWLKLKKVVAWLLRARRNLRNRVTKRKELNKAILNAKDPQEKRKLQEDFTREQLDKCHQINSACQRISIDNLQEAELALVRYEQMKYFPNEIEALKSKGDTSRQGINKSSRLLKLDPILSEELIRVGGRLERSSLPFASKHPLVLPKESPLSRLILQEAHKQVGHLGKNSILAKVRQTYWILGGSAEIKKMLSKCVTCRRYQSRPETQKMSSLPEERLIPDEPPFSRIGMDYFGPFEVKRGRTTIKRYGVLFTCLATRAVHIEVAASLDTDSCIHAIRRFVARRGIPSFIRSDNGTNLVGAERELREAFNSLNLQKIEGTMLQQGIRWEFNPPSGSHFGGVWERLIRLVRKVLYSLMHTQTVRLDDEGIHTLFCEVESILNGRPLTESPNSPNDLDVLTPNHLLLLRSGETMPPGSFEPSDNYCKRRWRQVQYLADLFWKRWIREYLPLLQERQKWNITQRNLAIGDIVLVMDSTPRNSWALGRVVEVMKDKKGLVRIVQVRTRSTTLKRPVAKLCKLIEAGTDC